MKAEFIGGPFDGDTMNLEEPPPYRLSRWLRTVEIPFFEGFEVSANPSLDYVDYYLEIPPVYGDLKYVYRPY